MQEKSLDAAARPSWPANLDGWYAPSLRQDMATASAGVAGRIVEFLKTGHIPPRLRYGSMRDVITTARPS